MSLSYNDLTLLRYIQKRQMIPLSKTALHFQKNESSIRRTIEQINLYSSEPMVRIEKSICYSCISYEDLVSFIRNLDQKDYLSSSDERIRVMITAIFFQNYVNSSKLYEQWGLSLTTKKTGHSTAAAIFNALWPGTGDKKEKRAFYSGR